MINMFINANVYLESSSCDITNWSETPLVSRAIDVIPILVIERVIASLPGILYYISYALLGMQLLLHVVSTFNHIYQREPCDFFQEQISCWSDNTAHIKLSNVVTCVSTRIQLTAIEVNACMNNINPM